MFRILAISCLVLMISFASAKAPAVSIEYSQTLDDICAFFKGPKIEDAQKNEMSERFDEFRSLWNSIGTELLVATEEITGKAFPEDEIAAYLTLCSVPSQSIIGISVNMRYALASITDEPVSFSYKAAVLYHEILHGFIVEHMPEESRLLALHSDEPSRVLNHLHLLALLKSVYLSRDMGIELAEVIEIDGKLPGGFYKRAWELVNGTEDTHRLYVAELVGKLL